MKQILTKVHGESILYKNVSEHEITVSSPNVASDHPNTFMLVGFDIGNGNIAIEGMAVDYNPYLSYNKGIQVYIVKGLIYYVYKAKKIVPFGKTPGSTPNEMYWEELGPVKFEN